MMCRGDTDRQSQLVAYGGLKNVLADPTHNPFGSLQGGINPAALAEYQRLQLYDYAQAAAAASRLRFAHPAFMPSPYGLAAAFPPMTDGQPGISTYGLSPFVRFDPRARFVQEEPKPQHSYIGLIAMAILSSPDKKMVLSDIYQHILDQYPYFRNRGPGWRNSIRHNLSLNDCFIKAGRSANGKGHYWAIHPANIEDFKKGDFRRRKAQRKVRKHMGLSVPDDDDSPTPTPPPQPPQPPTLQVTSDPNSLDHHELGIVLCSPRDAPHHKMLSSSNASMFIPTGPGGGGGGGGTPNKFSILTGTRKRQFDMESLLAPDPVHAGQLSPQIDVDCEVASPRLESTRSFTTSPGSDSVDPNCLQILTDKDRRGESNLKDLSMSHEPEYATGPDPPDQDRAEKEVSLSRAASSTSAMRRAMQWTMSLPLQNMGLHQRIPFGTVSGFPFSVSSPCWSPAQAASFLSYSVTAASTANVRGADMPIANPAPTSAVGNPSIHRWQETISRVVLENDNSGKIISQ